MKYIIDANNLAGKLKWLGEKNFDKKLIITLEKYFKDRCNKVVLVFDGSDPLGDKVVYEYLTVIYAPKDKYCRSADDKIVELLEREVGSEYFARSKIDELRIVSDDAELKKRIDKIIKESRINLKFISSTVLANELLSSHQIKTKQEDGLRGLNGGEINNINRDLMDIWR